MKIYKVTKIAEIPQVSTRTVRSERGKNIQVLIKSINAQLSVLINNGYAIYDEDNRDYFIAKIRYDSGDDKLVFNTIEEITGKDDENND